MRKVTVTKMVEVELEDETIEIELTVWAYYDANYGADADGNRGIGVWEVDDYDYEMPEDLNDGEKDMVRTQLHKVIDNLDFSEAEAERLTTKAEHDRESREDR